MGSLLVRRFLTNDDTVIATDTADEGLKKLREAQAGDAKLHTVSGDISSEGDCAKVADLARSTAGRVDVLINVAGYFPIQSYDEMTATDFRKVVDIKPDGHVPDDEGGHSASARARLGADRQHGVGLGVRGRR